MRGLPDLRHFGSCIEGYDAGKQDMTSLQGIHPYAGYDSLRLESGQIS